MKRRAEKAERNLKRLIKLGGCSRALLAQRLLFATSTLFTHEVQQTVCMYVASKPPHPSRRFEIFLQNMFLLSGQTSFPHCQLFLFCNLVIQKIEKKKKAERFDWAELSAKSLSARRRPSASPVARPEHFGGNLLRYLLAAPAQPNVRNVARTTGAERFFLNGARLMRSGALANGTKAKTKPAAGCR